MPLVIIQNLSYFLAEPEYMRGKKKKTDKAMANNGFATGISKEGDNYYCGILSAERLTMKSKVVLKCIRLHAFPPNIG